MDINVPIRVVESSIDYNKLYILHNKKTIEIEKPMSDFFLVEAGKYQTPSWKTILARKKKEIMGTGKIVDIEAIPFHYYGDREYTLKTIKRADYPTDYISYIERLYINIPDFIRKYPSQNISFISWDIETTHDPGIFPHSDKDPIVSLSWKLSTDDNINNMYIGEFKEEDIIKNFLNYLRNTEFDILVGYNHKEFDLPYFIQRCMFHNIDWSDVFIPPAAGISGVNFIIADDYELAKSDQTLVGRVNNFKMKTVAKHFNISTIEEDMEHINDLVINKNGEYYNINEDGPKKLIKYNNSDVNITEELFKIYLPGKSQVAEQVGIDMDTILNGFDSTLGNIIMGRINKEMNIVALGNNIDRYGKEGYIAQLYNPEKSDDILTSFTGAISLAIKKGLFKNVSHFDFKSMYPSTILNYRMGPDNTRIVGIGKYDPSLGIISVKSRQYDEDNKVSKIIFTIPDNNIKKNIDVQINYGKPSKLAEYIENLFEARIEYKKKYNEHKNKGDTKGEEKYYSMQWAIKVVLNSLYGYFGMKRSKYGGYEIALTTTALCRNHISHMAYNYFKDKSIEIDTDGIYVQGNYNGEEVNKECDRFIEETYGIPNKRMIMEDEGTYESMFVHKTKNYILKLHNGTYKRTGVALKSSSKTTLYRLLLLDIIPYIMEERNPLPVILKWLNFSELPIDAFTKRASIGAPESYKSSSKMYIRLAKQYQEYTKSRIMNKVSIDYVITKDDDNNKHTQKIIQLCERGDISEDYYINELMGILDIFKIESPDNIIKELYNIKFDNESINLHIKEEDIDEENV